MWKGRKSRVCVDRRIIQISLVSGLDEEKQHKTNVKGDLERINEEVQEFLPLSLGRRVFRANKEKNSKKLVKNSLDNIRCFRPHCRVVLEYQIELHLRLVQS